VIATSPGTTLRRRLHTTWNLLVVSNTSPVPNNLAILGDLDLFRRKLGRVMIPDAVRHELSRLAHPDARHSIETALRDGWVAVAPVEDRQLLPGLQRRIDAGEAEAIADADATAATNVPSPGRPQTSSTPAPANATRDGLTA